MGTLPTAASQENSSQQTANEDTVIEEIIVTAQKRKTPAQDVPISMSVFAGADLEALNLTQVAGVARYTPNLEWDTSFLGASNWSAIFIRGIGHAGNFAEHSTDPGVGVYLDGVYIGRSVGSALSVLDIAQVEVLRGPQGTLFGKNTVGGAVTLVSTRPSGTFSGWADATAGSDNRGDLRLAVNVPITDQVWTRFSAASLNRDGYGKSIQDGTEFGDVNTDSFRGALRWLPGDDLTIDFIADWTRTREASPTGTLVVADADPLSLTGAYNFFVAPTNSVDGFGTGVHWDARFMTPGNFTNYATGESGSDLDTQGVTAIVDWRPGELTFTSISGYRDLDSKWAVDADLSPLTIIEDIIGLEQRQFSQEFNLQGRHGSLDWLVGLYYFDEEASALGGAIIIPEVAAVESDPVFGAPNPLFGIPLSSPPCITSGCWTIVNEHSARSVAAFAHMDYGFSERFNAFGGLRYTSEKRRISNQPGTGLVASNGNSKTFTNASPTLGLQYYLDESLQLYASVSEGFKSGGFNHLVLIPRQDYLPYNPEEVTSYEIGFKASSDRMRLAAAAFYSNYNDIQIAVLNGVEPQTLNAAEAEIRGGELELLAVLTANLKLQAGLGYLDAEYTRLYEAGLAGLVIPVTLDSKLMNTPRWSVNLNLIYSTDLRGIGQLTIRGDYSWRDRIYKDAINTNELVQEPYGILHAGATLVSESRRWEFTLFGDNLTDESYIQSGTANKPDFGLVLANYARPRTWGLRVKYSFGNSGGSIL
jgi:iron complex outermembrane receptor protein